MNTHDESAPPPSPPVGPEDAAVAGGLAPARPGPADQTLADDEGAYEAAVSEGWRVAPPGRGGGMPADVGGVR